MTPTPPFRPCACRASGLPEWDANRGEESNWSGIGYVDPSLPLKEVHPEAEQPVVLACLTGDHVDGGP